MKIIDLHCDVLTRMYYSKGTLDFNNSPELDVNHERLRSGGVQVQAFAIFIPPDVSSDEKFQMALDQIYYFHTEILEKNPSMHLLTDWADFQSLPTDHIGVFLTLEGVDAIGNDMKKLFILYQLGVRSIGLTWNNANLAADGAGEERGGGLTSFGKDIIRFCNKHLLFSDVSHLSERSFWDVIDIADYPIASHSNSKTICNHRRNLTDEQAVSLLKKKGLIHVVYNPPFIVTKDEAHISDLIAHIDHFCSLGAVKQIGFGSDFDGISSKVVDLEDASMHPNLINQLLKKYTEDEVKGFAFQNFLNHLPGRQESDVSEDL